MVLGCLLDVLLGGNMASNINCTDDLDNANFCDGVLSATTTTSDAAATTIASIPVPEDTQVRFHFEVIARRTDVAGTGWAATMTGTFQNNGGTVSQIGSTSLSEIDSSLLLTNTASFVISGTDILIKVTGESSKNYSWRAAGKYTRA